MSDSPKTPADFTDTGIPITAWSFYEVFERKHCGTGWLRSQMSDIEIKLTAAKQQLDEVTKQRDALQEWKESAMKVESSWDAQAVGQLLEMKLGSAILPQIEPAIRKMIAQRDGLRGALKIAMTRAYAIGYQHGHDDSVESVFTVVSERDTLEYFAEDIEQMLLDGSQPEAAALLGYAKGGES